ncbi:MAG: HAMP domain-containing sensor histidine kinase [Nitrospirales bacterium]|nr:HAMP domain-containing sensor histidine kinase [Nitrospirales bacterium]
MTDSSHEKKLNQRIQRLEQELEAARRISQALFQHLHVDDIVKQALQVALEVVNAQAGCVLLARPDAQELVFYHAIGEKAPSGDIAIPWDKGIAGQVFQSGEPMVIGDVKKDVRHFQEVDLATGFTTRDLIAIPLKRWEGDPVGVMEVMNKRDGSLNKDDLSILTIISAATAVAVEESRLSEERKLAEVGRMVGDIGHDIKNMLMPVANGTWLLKSELDDLYKKASTGGQDEKDNGSRELCEEILDMIGRNTRRIQDRVTEIADCVKGLSSPPQFKPCKLKEILASVLQSLQFDATQKGVLLNMKGLEEVPEIEADERRLFNAFYNLVNNAIAEVPGGGSIMIIAQPKPDNVSIVVSVVDTGPGMPEEVRKSLFTKRVVSRKPGGTGLGTKIVKDVVDSHGGEISVDSQIGVGTTFNIRLPIHPHLPQSTNHL